MEPRMPPQTWLSRIRSLVEDIKEGFCDLVVLFLLAPLGLSVMIEDAAQLLSDSYIPTSSADPSDPDHPVDEETEMSEIIGWDVNGNVTYSRNSDGFEYWQECDDNGNFIHYRNSDGYEVWWERDEDSNCTHTRDNKGFSWGTPRKEKGDE